MKNQNLRHKTNPVFINPSLPTYNEEMGSQNSLVNGINEHETAGGNMSWQSDFWTITKRFIRQKQLGLSKNNGLGGLKMLQL